MPQITFDVETKAQPTLVLSTRTADGDINKIVPLTGSGEKSQGRMLISPGRVLLTWIFVGAPATTYKITIKPTAKVTLSRGKNPIESSIATREVAGTGSVFLKVTS